MSNSNKLEDAEHDEGFYRGVTSERSAETNVRLDHQTNLLSVLYSPEHAEGTILIIFKDKSSVTEENKEHAFLKLKQNPTSRIAVLNEAVPTGLEVIRFAEAIIAELEQKGLKRITLIGIEDGASVVQALTILEPRLIRRAVLINPNSRVNPTLLSKCIDWIENFLPIGLPFRALTKEFDSRPFVHRIRCPVLMIVTPSESFYRLKESEYLSLKIPNCYFVKTTNNPIIGNDNEFSDEFIEFFERFQKSPVKRPQKNVKL